MKRKLAVAALALMAVIAVRVALHWDDPCISVREFRAPEDAFTCKVKALSTLFYVPERTFDAGSYRELAIGMTRAEAIEALRELKARSLSAIRKLAGIDDARGADLDGVIVVVLSGDRAWERLNVSDFSGSASGLPPAIPGLRVGQSYTEWGAVITDYWNAHRDAGVQTLIVEAKPEAGGRFETWTFGFREPRADSSVTIAFSEGRIATIHVTEWPVVLS